MITELWVENQPVDLYSDTNIKYTFQANDIAEVKIRRATYTDMFHVPKTPNNVRVFGGLGINSETSASPYGKLLCRVKIDGFDLITKGRLS